MTYTIKEIADLAGVTTRTIRYYDEIGILAPTEIGENGYRYYDQGSLMRLQQILFFRELDVPLKDIQQIMTLPNFSLLEALETHRAALISKADRLAVLINTVDETIAAIQGAWQMNDKDYFKGFDETKYEEEARQRWGSTPEYAETQKKWSSYTEDQKEAIKIEGGEIISRMVDSDAAKPDDLSVQAAIADYHAYISKHFYTLDAGMLRNLADMWVQDPRFAANFERVRKGGAEFVRKAVHIYYDRQAG